MHLINTRTYIVTEFTPEQAPPYAILSHRWLRRELQFRDLQPVAGASPTAAPGLRVEASEADLVPSVRKIQRFCDLARARDGLEFAWVDACCIDKASSAELSEAINAMFAWYRDAAVCYVYLHDVKAGAGVRGTTFIQPSEWFERGWTLQELLAPRALVLFDGAWEELGTREEFSVDIVARTGIMQEHLVDFRAASIAQRMCWASGRVTTRGEDMAYCLLGIFEVNLPLLYGEGQERAFRRLQLEILRTSSDESIFAWVDPDLVFSGMLARSVRHFSGSGDVVRLPHMRKPYSMTNMGLKIELEISMAKEPGRSWTAREMLTEYSSFMCARLHCTRDSPTSREPRRPLLIFLKFDENDSEPQSRLQPITQCCRRADMLQSWDSNETTKLIWARKLFVREQIKHRMQGRETNS